jgi:hypothetical protein
MIAMTAGEFGSTPKSSTTCDHASRHRTLAYAGAMTRALDNLGTKLQDPTFTTDLELLVAQWPARYRIDDGAAAAESIIAAIDKLDTAPS